MDYLKKKAAENLHAIRENTPLIHNITNYVVMNFTANVLLSLGASPVMAHAEGEVEEMSSLSSALVINIGTLSDPWIRSMIKAGKTASASGKPIILDPVGAGATKYRTDTAKKIIHETNPAVIRGNASEILSLQGSQGKTKGVDSVHSVDQTAGIACDLAADLKTVIAVTGKEDLVTDGSETVRIKNGHELMGCITGTGCAATAVTGAFCAVDPNPFTATLSALLFFGLAGEIAATAATAPGSYMVALIDALYTITPEMLEKGSRPVGA